LNSLPKPRLLVLTSTLPRWAGDSEPRFVLDLTRTLADRFDAVILAPMAIGAAKSETLEGVRVERYAYAPYAGAHILASPGAIMPNLRRNRLLYLLVPFLMLGLFAALFRILRRERFDAVHCHWIVPQGLMLWLVSFFVDVPPTLVTCHGGDAFTLEFAPFSGLKHRILDDAVAVSVVSQEIADHFAGRTTKAMEHIPMGVDLDRFTMRDAKKVAKNCILFAGRLAEKKGLDRLITAMADPRLIERKAKLSIAGDGPLKNELEQQAAVSPNAKSITFLGPLTHAEISAEMQRASLFCAPFVVAADGDREGTPTVLMEAAASGIPIVTSDIGGCRDIVANDKSGWLLSSGDDAALRDALVDALDNPAKAAKMAKEARRRAEEYSWPNVARRFGDVLQQIAA
jgi:glycosyltransferase involved in cell wall biosynthesis